MKNIRLIRTLVAFGVLACIFIASFVHVSTGTYCLLCPIGFTEIAVASRSIPWKLLPGVMIIVVGVFFLGRIFCSWLCPTAALKNLFGGRKPRGLIGESGNLPSGNNDHMLAVQGIILAVLLVISFVVHFPVFCLFCPIGITMGIIFAISKMFITWTLGWEIVVFPLMLIAELFLFKRWCAAICPIGFFFGAMAKLRTKAGFAVGPKAESSTCLTEQGCRVCSTTCPEDIDVARAKIDDLEKCTLCLECKGKCPSSSIKFGVVKNNRKKQSESVEDN